MSSLFHAMHAVLVAITCAVHSDMKIKYTFYLAMENLKRLSSSCLFGALSYIVTARCIANW